MLWVYLIHLHVFWNTGLISRDMMSATIVYIRLFIELR